MKNKIKIYSYNWLINNENPPIRCIGLVIGEERQCIYLGHSIRMDVVQNANPTTAYNLNFYNLGPTRIDTRSKDRDVRVATIEEKIAYFRGYYRFKEDIEIPSYLKDLNLRVPSKEILLFLKRIYSLNIITDDFL